MLKLNYFSDRHYIQRIQENDKTVLGEIYIKYEKHVFNYIKTHGGDEFDAEDMLQESIIVLWQNVNNGKFNLSSRLGTYLVAVAKNKWRSQLRKRNKISDVELPQNRIHQDEDPLELVLAKEDESIIQNAFDLIQPVCKQLLILFYFEERSLEDITKILNFSNTDVTKSKKYQCKKSLETILHKQAESERRKL